jgi:hypothetical protein
VEYDPVFFDRELHTLQGGRAHYFRRVGEKLLEREPAYGSVDFIIHAEAAAERGEYTPMTLRWFEEQRISLPHQRAAARPSAMA